jgi:FkbM family methyltransferase
MNAPRPPLPWRDRLLAAWFRRGWRGRARLAHALRLQDSILARTLHDSVFALQTFGYIDQIVLRSGYYESEVLAALLPHLGPGAVLWDIGANFGLHGITAKQLSPATEVVCFEPAAATHARMLQNIALNRVAIRSVSLALSDRAGYAPLHLGPVGNSGMTTLSPWPGCALTDTVLVATARGDALIDEGLLPAPTVIKIDVEGHELPVLNGLAHTLRTQSCRSVVFEDSTAHATPVKALLRTAGFLIEPLTRLESSSHTLDNFHAQK